MWHLVWITEDVGFYLKLVFSKTNSLCPSLKYTRMGKYAGHGILSSESVITTHTNLNHPGHFFPVLKCKM